MHVDSLTGIRPLVVVAFLLTALCFAGEERGRGDKQARQEWMLGFLKLEQAGSAEGDGHISSALGLYEEALAVFERVGNSYPAWHPELVRYRITFCKDRIQSLRETMALGLEKMSTPMLRAEVQRLRKEMKSSAARLAQLEGDARKLTDQTLASSAARARAEKRAQEAENARLAVEKQVESLSRQRDELRAELAARDQKIKHLETIVNDAAALRTTIADLEARAKSGDAAREQCTVLANKNDALTEECRRLQALADTMDRVGRERDAMRVERDNALEKAAASTAALHEQEMTSKVARVQRDMAQKEARAARDEQTRLRQECERLRKASRDAIETAAEAAKLKAELIETRRQAAITRAATSEKLRRAETADKDIQDLRAKVASLNEQLAAARAKDISKLEAHRLAAEKRLAAAQETLRRNEQQLTALREKEKAWRTEQEQQRLRASAAAAQTKEKRRRVAVTMAAAREALTAGRLAEARDQFRKVLELEPEQAQALHQLGATLAHTGDDSSAEVVLRQALRQSPDDPDVLLRLGIVLLRRGKVREAVAVFLQGTTVAPKQAELQHFLGVALSKLGWRTASEQALREAFKLDGSNAATAYDLAVLLASMDPPALAAARDWYKRALKLGAEPDKRMERVLGIAPP